MTRFIIVTSAWNDKKVRINIKKIKSYRNHSNVSLTTIKGIITYHQKGLEIEESAEQIDQLLQQTTTNCNIINQLEK